jgi:hypothetical protein
MELLRRVQYLRERAVDMERRTAEALERLNEITPPATPIVQVATEAEPPQDGLDELEQPSPFTDVRDSMQAVAQRMLDVERRLEEQLRAGLTAPSRMRLDGLKDEAGSLKREAMQERGRVNEEISQQEEEEDIIRLGPMPKHAGLEEEAIIAIPLASEGEANAERPEEQKQAQVRRAFAQCAEPRCNIRNADFLASHTPVCLLCDFMPSVSGRAEGAG